MITVGDVHFVEIPAGIPDIIDMGMSAGDKYNQLYTGGDEYEFHSIPYGILPPVKTGISIEGYKVITLFDVAETIAQFTEVKEAVKAAGGDLDKINYVIFKKR